LQEREPQSKGDRCIFISFFWKLEFLNLLIYNSCKRDTLWYLHMCLQYILITFTPPSFSLIPLSLFLKQFHQVSLFYFHKGTQNTTTWMIQKVLHIGNLGMWLNLHL
jgi:hypothetical protein